VGRQRPSSEEARASSDAELARLRLASVQARRERVARSRNEAATLHEAVRQARLDVVRREFARLSPLAQDIYSRLDPHPTFQDIDLVSELFRSAGTTIAQVRDPLFGVAADPMLVFSSAQANIAAISYVMALNGASSVGAPVLLLDDPMQAMDEVNVLGFAELCRHVRRQRQLIVSTHDRRFAHLLERKLAPRRPESAPPRSSSSAGIAVGRCSSPAMFPTSSINSTSLSPYVPPTIAATAPARSNG